MAQSSASTQQGSTQSPTSIAVITGDIVDSTKLSREEFDMIMYGLQSALATIKSGNDQNDFYNKRGDAFQVIIHDYHNALRYALYLRTYLKSIKKHFDCRLSIAIASEPNLRFHVESSMGEAFTLSGRGIESMNDERLLIQTDQGANIANRSLALIVKFIDKQITGLTTRQCEVLVPLLASQAKIQQKELAKMLNITEGTISSSLKRSEWGLISESIELFEHMMQG